MFSCWWRIPLTFIRINQRKEILRCCSDCKKIIPAMCMCRYVLVDKGKLWAVENWQLKELSKMCYKFDYDSI